MMKYIMAAESRRLYDRMSGDKLSEKQKEQMKSLMSDNMKDTELMTALWILSSILKEYYGEKVIILIDEYDVPLDKAFENNYYNEMIILLRNMLKQSLKTNDNLYMAVLTGCLRIARESIFTGLNNFNIFSITDQYFDEYFGFTDKEVKEILQYYKVPEAFEQTKKWYDGYRFGNRYLLPMGCNQSLPSIKSRTRCDTTAILDQYKWKLYRKTLYRESKPTDKKRN